MNKAQRFTRRLLASTIADGKQKKDASPPINPFVHTMDLTLNDRIKCYLLTVLLLPLRAVCVILCLLTSYLLVCIGTAGLSNEELARKPKSGWRKILSWLITTDLQFLFWFIGLRVRVIGRQASRKEAPILVIAPHSTFLDTFVAVWTGFPSLIVRSEEIKRPVVGKLMNYTHPIYVWREDPDSRRKTIEELKRRASAPEDDWRQILIFPEGTCSNRKSLISFKPGAFIPGVPVQPVCIRYPNRLDTVSWTWDGPEALELIWMTMTRLVTYCEMEFLPVYVPSVEEKGDPNLFADNVRDVMARAVNLPITNYSFEDGVLMAKARKLGLPPAIGLIEVGRFRQEFGLSSRMIQEDFLESFARFADRTLGTANIDGFAAYLNLPAGHPKVIELFSLYDSDRSGVINFKDYVRGRCVLSRTTDEGGPRKRNLELRWAGVKELLGLTPSQEQEIEGLVTQLSTQSDSNNNDVLGQLYAVIPEWRWIVSRLSRHPSSPL